MLLSVFPLVSNPTVRRSRSIGEALCARTQVPLCPQICLRFFCFFLASSGQKLRAVRADQVDSLGQRRHHAVGLGVGARNARGDENAAQNVRGWEYRRRLQASKEEEPGVVGAVVENDELHARVGRRVFLSCMWSERRACFCCRGRVACDQFQ